MDSLYANRLQAESAQYLSINLYNVLIDHTKAADSARFTITSPDDPAYAPSRKTRPLRTSSRTRAIRVALRKDLLVKHTAVFLALPQPMQPGKTYAVEVGDIGAAVPALAPVVFDDRRQTNDNIRVNQLGYLPGFAKFAYLGQYMGDGGGPARQSLGDGGLPFAAKEFQLLDASGRAVFTGQARRREVNEQLVGQQVHELDFSAFDVPGTYRIYVPGVGLSYPFDIGSAALSPAYANLMRGHYQQRCGMEITPEFSRHARPACHLDDAYLEQRAETTKFVQPKAPLYPTNYDNQRHDATRGHHDAGDYGKYTLTGAGYVFSILMALEIFTDRFQEDNFRLPYSGNGIPDLVDEAKWELDWLQNMQDPSDGGVFGVIRPNSGGYENSLPPPEAHRLFFPKDTVFTAAYAAALAHASASPVMRRHFPQDCPLYLARAKNAWEWLERNTRYVHYFHYGAVFDDADERAWAAAELYAATSEAKYHEYLLRNFDPSLKRWGWWGMFESVGYAAARYAFLKDRPKDPAMDEKCRAAIRDACAAHLKDSAEFPYRLSMPAASIKHGSYGWYFPGDLAGYDLLLGYALDGKREYLECALRNLDYEFGANPFGYFLQTGLGAKRNIEVVDNDSVFDRIIEPVPGLPLGIGSAGFYYLAKYDKAVGQGTYPPTWPLMNRWYDGFNVQSEFTMGPMARETIVAGYFGRLAPGPRGRPTVKIKADRLTGPAPLAVRFEAAAGSAGRIREYFWDFGDESFSTQAAPTHVFQDAGRAYPVCATVVDDQGLSAYATATVGCLIADAPFPREEFSPDADTIALYHFNGDLKDASGHGLDLAAKTGVAERQAFRFAAAPPLWMAKPAGSCLDLDGAEQFSVTIPRELLADPAETPLTLEVFIYVEEFAGWSYPGNPVLLGVAARYDSWLGWRQGTWEKARAPEFAGGAGAIIPAGKFADDFAREQWHHVRIAWDGRSAARFFLDGKLLGEAPGRPFKPAAKEPLVFSLGPFRGLVDEVRVSKSVRP
jgi:hypothetical protein